FRSSAGPNGAARGHQALRVLVVGGEGRAAELSSVTGADIVGNASPEDLVSAIDTLAPQVLLLSPALASLATRASSCPAGVVVAPSGVSEQSGPLPCIGPRLLEIALRLAIACP